MEDRELLELAAKAAGYDYSKFCGYIVVDGIPGNWNPLTDDGDALRLAVKLNMTIFATGKSVIAELDSDCDDPPIHKKEYCDDETKYAATRRAIVRAAAEIGKGAE